MTWQTDDRALYWQQRSLDEQQAEALRRMTEEQVELAHDVACNNAEGEEVLFPGLNRDLPHPVWLSLVVLLLWGLVVAGGLVCA